MKKLKNFTKFSRNSSIFNENFYYSSIYDKIYEFCSVKNNGLATNNPKNGDPTPRVKYLMGLLDSLGIDYILDSNIHPTKKMYLHNIIMLGGSNKMVVAHHDIVNPNSDNANDNSASVINAIALKQLRPDLNVVLLDGEEVKGLGSEMLCDRLLDYDDEIFKGKKIEWVLNLELTGKGGDKFFIGNYPGKLFSLIKSKFPDCGVFRTPFNDSVVFIQNGIDSVVINPLPPMPDPDYDCPTGISIYHGDVRLDHPLLFNCHRMEDSLDTIDPKDMEIFVNEVLLKIV